MTKQTDGADSLSGDFAGTFAGSLSGNLSSNLVDDFADSTQTPEVHSQAQQQALTPLIPGGVLRETDIVPAHFGNPFREEEQLISGRAFSDLRVLEVLRVAGSDRTKWLHSLTTCPFAFIGADVSSEMLVLSPYGQIEHAAAVIDDGTQVWMILDVGRAAALADFFQQMKFMMRVEIERCDLSIIGFSRPIADLPVAIRESAVFAWADPWPDVAVGGAHYGIAPANHPATGIFRSLLAFADDAQLAQLLRAAIAAGWQPAGTIAWEAARIRCWRPRPNREMLPGVLPHELDLLRSAVHLEKGCYRGQETVAKIVNLGRPPRRLTYLYLESPDGELPSVGAPVFKGKRQVGVLTSVARDYEDGPVALALLKRSVDPSAVLTIGQAAPSKETNPTESVSPAENLGSAQGADLEPNQAATPETIATPEIITAAPEILATQVEIVSHGGKSSVSPAQRPGSEMLHRGK